MRSELADDTYVTRSIDNIECHAKLTWAHPIEADTTRPMLLKLDQLAHKSPHLRNEHSDIVTSTAESPSSHLRSEGKLGVAWCLGGMRQ